MSDHIKDQEDELIASLPGADISVLDDPAFALPEDEEQDSDDG